MDQKYEREGQSGGVNVSGGSLAASGDVVGRDKITMGQEISIAQLEQLLLPLVDAVRGAPPDTQAEAMGKVEALKREVAKGKEASDGVVAMLLDGIVGLVPGAITAVVSAFSSPILGGIAGPVTKFVLDKIQGK